MNKLTLGSKPIVMVVLLFAVAATAIIISVSAASSGVTFDPSSSGNKTDSSAHGGSFVEFKQQGAGQVADVTVNPGDNLSALVESGPAGTVFLLKKGVHKGFSFQPKDRMEFIGEDGAVMDGTGAPKAFGIYGAAKNVLISNIEIKNYENLRWPSSTGTAKYYAAAIHGNSFDASNDTVGVADGWIIDKVVAHHNGGSGVSVGNNFTVTNGKFYRNGINGLSGGDFYGGLIEGNEVYENNHPSNARGGDGWDAAGMKFACVNQKNPDSCAYYGGGSNPNKPNTSKDGTTPFIVRNNDVWGNIGAGIWCDIYCVNVVIEDNYIHDHTAKYALGIFYEVSFSGTIRNNRIVNSVGTESGGQFVWGAAIFTWNSSGTLIEGNKIENSRVGIILYETSRGEDWPHSSLNDNTVKNNFTEVKSGGSRMGILGRSSNVLNNNNVFTGNTYSDTSQMKFYYNMPGNDGSNLGYAEWQSKGFQ